MATSIPDPANFLRREFLRDARVLDAKLGYISVSSFNLRMKPQVLSAAARLGIPVFSCLRVKAVTPLGQILLH